MVNIVLICFSLFYRLTWVRRCWPRAAPDFGSVSVISSFLLQGILIHAFSRFGRRLNAVCYLVFRRIFAHISQFFRLRLRATDAEPLIDALLCTYLRVLLYRIALFISYIPTATCYDTATMCCSYNRKNRIGFSTCTYLVVRMMHTCTYVV